MILVFNSCLQPERNYKVTDIHIFGTLKGIMGGKLESNFDLMDLSNKKNVYALGAEQNLKGEIQVFNSKSMFSSVADSRVRIDSSFNHKASLLVYAEVPEWDTVNLPAFESLSRLELEIYRLAESKGIDVDEPFPFMLEGMIDSISWHVIDWNENDKVHTHEKHKASGQNGILNHKLVQVLGFYSKNHKGVFTHHSRDSHMHFHALDGSLAGHVDEISTVGNLYLKLPKK